MSEAHLVLVERLYDCFNERDEAGIVEICDPVMEFFPIVTAQAVGRDAPYGGPAGLHQYLADVGEVWEELQISPDQVEESDGVLLVHGRVYARSRELGIRDMPIAWIWEVKNERFVRGEVFPDPEQAIARFAAAAA